MDRAPGGQRFFASTTASSSRKHAVLSLVVASLVTFLLIFSLSRASWTDFGAARAPQAWYDDECLNTVSEGRWELSTDGCPATSPGVLSHCSNSTGLPRRWTSSAPAGCLPPSLVQADVAKMFQDKRIAFVGDSHLRKLYNFMGEFLADDQITVAPSSDKKEHKDFSTTVKATGTRLEFYWRAEIRSTASVLNEFLEIENEKEAPDLIVCDASAHQAKWARDYGAFKDELPALVEAVTKYQEKFPASTVVWLISPPFKEVYDLSNPETEFFYSLRKFNAGLRGAGMFVPHGPVVPIDMYRIAEGCIDYCYRDNTHVLPSVNVLLFEMITGAHLRHATL